MKFKYLIASAALVIGVAAYTLTLSFTETDLMSQLEALANGENGESGGGNEGENPESGGTRLYKIKDVVYWCVEHRWIQVSDGNNGYNWSLIRMGDKPKDVPGTECVPGSELVSCTPYDPCNPAKPI